MRESVALSVMVRSENKAKEIWPAALSGGRLRGREQVRVARPLSSATIVMMPSRSWKQTVPQTLANDLENEKAAAGLLAVVGTEGTPTRDAYIPQSQPWRELSQLTHLKSPR